MRRSHRAVAVTCIALACCVAFFRRLDRAWANMLAEIASGTTKTIASIAVDFKESYFHFTAVRQSGSGVVR